MKTKVIIYLVVLLAMPTMSLTKNPRQMWALSFTFERDLVSQKVGFVPLGAHIVMVAA